MPAGNRRPLYSDGDLPVLPSAPPPTAPPDLAHENVAQPESTADAQQAVGTATFRQPCTLKGLASAAYAGALGYFLGFVPATFKFKARQWGMIHSQGMTSASQLALMSGMYTAVHCICQRVRMVEDGWNRGIAGCSTGLVLGWKAGPWSALQSCAGIGLLSALIDLGGGAVEAAEASVLCQLERLQEDLATQHQQQQARHGAQGNPFELLMLAMASPTVQAALQQQQQWVVGRKAASGTSSGHSSGSGGAMQQQHWQQHKQLVAAAQAVAGPLPDAMAAAAQQLLAAPPLAFLSACCSSSNSKNSSTAATSSSRSARQAVAGVVDACALSREQQQPRSRSKSRSRGKRQL